MTEQQSASAIVVGIDGSRSAVETALWAVDEAVSRDIQAVMAVESTDRPVKIEVEILRERPVRALKEASRWAAMLCVGSIGLKHHSNGRIGSTASALATSAHCPVAIVHAHPGPREEQSWVVAEIQGSASSDGALLRALDEAQLRNAPLRVLMTWQPRYTDIHDHRAVTEGNRLAKARLERRLTQWRRRHPDLHIEAVAVRGTFLNYLADNAGGIQLIVVAHDRAHGISELVGSPGCCVLRRAGCSVLVSDPQTVL